MNIRHYLVESVRPCGGELNSESVDTFGLMLNELQMSSMTACHWIINNEQKETIELKIFRMHLPDDDMCTSAFIEVSETSHFHLIVKCEQLLEY